MNTMNRSLLFAAAVGVIYGLVGLTGMVGSQLADSVLWLTLFSLFAVWLGFAFDTGHFWRGAATAGVMVISAYLLPALYWNTYTANNHRVLEQMEQVPPGQELQYFLVFAPVMALIGAVITGAFSWLAGLGADAATGRKQDDSDSTEPDKGATSDPGDGRETESEQ